MFPPPLRTPATAVSHSYWNRYHDWICLIWVLFFSQVLQLRGDLGGHLVVPRGSRVQPGLRSCGSLRVLRLARKCGRLQHPVGWRNLHTQNCTCYFNIFTELYRAVVRLHYIINTERSIYPSNCAKINKLRKRYRSEINSKCPAPHREPAHLR